VEAHFQLDTSSARCLDVEVLVRVVGAKCSGGAAFAESSQSLIVVAYSVKKKASLNNGCKRPGWTKQFFKGSLEFKSKHDAKFELQGPGTILVQNRSASFASDVHHRQLRGRLVKLYETHCSDSTWATDNCLAEVP